MYVCVYTLLNSTAVCLVYPAVYLCIMLLVPLQRCDFLKYGNVDIRRFLGNSDAEPHAANEAVDAFPKLKTNPIPAAASHRTASWGRPSNVKQTLLGVVFVNEQLLSTIIQIGH